MERFIADLVGKFETGTISRRDFCEGVALAAVVCAAGGAEANAAQAGGLKMLGINHISYACPDYRKARDFYSSVLGMEKLKDDGKSRVNLAFGPAPGMGGAFLVARNAAADAPAPARAVVDHVCYSISNWNDARVNAALKAQGQNPAGRSGSVNVYDPFNFQVQLASAEAENPFI